MAIAAPTIIPASALGQGARPAPSKRVTLGVVGCGWQGTSNTDSFLALKDCQIIAACDLVATFMQLVQVLVDCSSACR